MRDASSEGVLSFRASKRCLKAKQEGEGGPDPFHHLRDPANQDQQGQGEAHCCLAWEAPAGMPKGLGGLAGGLLEMGVFLQSLHSSVLLSPSAHQSTPNATEVPLSGSGELRDGGRLRSCFQWTPGLVCRGETDW